MAPDHSTSSVTTHSPGPRDVYLLTLGLLAGLVLGPMVLGRAWPSGYSQAFTGIEVELRQSLDEATRTYAERRDRLVATDVTAIALTELEEAHLAEVQPLLERIARQYENRLHDLRQVLSGLIVALIAIMVVEAVIPPARRRGLATARYALLAVWIALALAQPALIHGLPLVFTAALIVIALAAALVPLRRGA